jgi:hypothetical protein
MSRRLLLRAVLLVVVLAGALALPGVRWPLWGWLRGEAFYKGRPTSYWSRQIQDYARQADFYNRHRPPSMQPEGVNVPATPVDSLRCVCGLSYHVAPLPYPFEAKGPAATPALTELLRDGDPYVRRYAADCLGDLGPVAKPAVPALLALYRDEGLPGSVRDTAAQALKQIDPQAAAEARVP